MAAKYECHALGNIDATLVMKNKRKKKKEFYELAFSKGASTVFIIETPFQLLCALEAINEFQINHYLIVVPYVANSYRWLQLKSMLIELGLTYEAIPITNKSHYDLFTQEGIFSDKKEKYSRIITGGYYSLIARALCTLYASNESVCVYLDDGTATISMLNGLETFIEYEKPSGWFNRKKWYNESYKPYMDIVNKISMCWHNVGLHDYNFLYTIYSYTNNSKFSIYQNQFSKFRNNIENVLNTDEIWILGTVSSTFSGSLQISKIDFEAVMWSLLAKLRKKHPTRKILFIPHVDDKNENIRNFCNLLDIRYERLSYCVEYYSYRTKRIPNMLVGFGSTALSTFKIINPNISVVNWCVIRTGINLRIPQMIAEYFKLMNIDTEFIELRGISFWVRMKRNLKFILRAIGNI